MRYRLLLTFAAVLMCAGASAVAAYPEKPIRIIAPWPPGSTTDGSARIIAKALEQRLKQTVLVENKPGANGTIGSAFVAKAPPDGYTLLMANGDTHSISPHIYSSLQYDALKDFDPVALVATASFVLIARPTLKESTLREVIAAAKRESGKLNYASTGVGSSLYLAAELFTSLTGTRMTNIPYKGNTQAIADVMSGQVDLAFGGISAVSAQVEAGRLKALAVAPRSAFRRCPNCRRSKKPA